MWEIEFYRSDTGHCPMEEYLDGLGVPLRAKTLRSIQLLRCEGVRLREPDTKPIGDGLFELRTQVGSSRGRCLLFFCVGSRIVITHGFLKHSRKTPPWEIERARRLRDDYLGRCAEESDGRL